MFALMIVLALMVRLDYSAGFPIIPLSDSMNLFGLFNFNDTQVNLLRQMQQFLQQNQIDVRALIRVNSSALQDIVGALHGNSQPPALKQLAGHLQDTISQAHATVAQIGGQVHRNVAQINDHVHDTFSHIGDQLTGSMPKVSGQTRPEVETANADTRGVSQRTFGGGTRSGQPWITWARSKN